MLQQTLASMATEFAATLIRTLRAAPIDELSELLAETDAPATAPQVRAAAPAASKPTPRRRARRRAPRGPKTAPAPVMVDDSKAREATVAYYAERGAKGATTRQVAEHLAGLGLDADASDRVVDTLVADGAVRDAGFRRAAGRNATAAVYVATGTPA